MRQTYLVTYDICDPKRLRQVYQLMRGYGDHLQLSVFRCDLSARERIELRSQLLEIIDTAQDQVLFADLGPSEGRARDAIASVGRTYLPPERLAVVV